MSAAVGADIEALCNKCGDVWHVVVAKVGANIVKVQCKECHGYHRYRPPPGSVQKKAPAVRRSRSSSPKRAEGSGPTRTASEPSIQPDPNKPSRPYKMSEIYETGEQITHLRFGLGVVENASEPGKIAVVFESGRKFLATAKSSSTLETAATMAKARAGAGDPDPVG